MQVLSYLGSGIWGVGASLCKQWAATEILINWPTPEAQLLSYLLSCSQHLPFGMRRRQEEVVEGRHKKGEDRESSG